MPTYEYQCDMCLQNFEVFQKFSEKPLRKHPECGGKVEKVFHPRGVTFKGSGFYVNDSRSKNGKAPDESSTSESSASETSKGKTKEKSSRSSDSGTSAIAADKATVTSTDSKGD